MTLPTRFPFALACLGLSAATASATTDKYRVIWNTTPESAATIGWCQTDGEDPKVFYGEASGDPNAQPLPSTRAVDHQTSHHNLDSRFARLTGLKPDTVYHFVIRDSNSESPSFSFKTAPAGEGSFSFVAGGDSRNHRDARQRANKTVAILQPLFVCFGGDMINKSTPKEWAAWLDDWQLTTDKNGRMIPIIAARGNHEGKADIHSFFDTPNADDYYSVGFGGGFLRVYTLNSNIVRAGAQGKWLGEDLSENAATKWKVAHYHHPFRPHQSGKTEQHAQYNAWAPLFFEHGLDLAIECDSHVVKRTWPLRPSNEPGSDQGFIRDDAFGTTFIGEGCWGAPIRANDDDKKWTRASDSFNQVNWICVTPDKLFTRTIMVDSIDSVGAIDPSDPFALPEGMKIWEPESGAVVTLLPRTEEGRPDLTVDDFARVKIIASEQKFAETTLVQIHFEGGDLATVREIRYTLDGTAPTSASNVYDGPFEVSTTTTIRAALFEVSRQLTEPDSLTVTRKEAN